jgi:V8-like Glu-specific endopeptidase
VKLYAAPDPYEDLLLGVLKEAKDIETREAGEGAAQLLYEIRRASPFQMGVLELLRTLFDIGGSKIKNMKNRFKNFQKQEIPPAAQMLEQDMAQFLREVYRLVDLLTPTLFHKQTVDKNVRRKALLKSLETIAQWLETNVIFRNAKLMNLPEGMLLKKLVLKLWQQFNEFLLQSGGRPKELTGITPFASSLDAFATKNSRQRRATWALVALAALLFASAGGLWSFMRPHGFKVEKALENIVYIKTPTSRGTGFFIKPNRLIVSNYHVVSPFTEATVSVKRRGNGELPPLTFKAKVLAHNETDDVAILKLEASESFVEAPLGFEMANDSAFRIGQVVHVLGNPAGLTDIYTRGTIMKAMENMALMDVKIGPGNSGGPVCDERGVVIGITTAYAKAGEGSFSYGIAISAERAWSLIAQMPYGEAK